MTRLTFHLITLFIAGCYTCHPLAETTDGGGDDRDVTVPSDGTNPFDAAVDSPSADDAGDVPPTDSAMDVTAPDPKTSTVCSPTDTEVRTTDEPIYRLRVGTSAEEIFFASVHGRTGDMGTVRRDDPDLVGGNEVRIDTGPPTGSPNALEVNRFDATSIGLDVRAFQPIWVVARENTTECAFVQASGPGSQVINCGTPTTLWGAEVVNNGGQAQYFWFDDDGNISAMDFESTANGGGQLLVPWCASTGSGCVALDIEVVDARPSTHSHVLLSDSDGAAYVWDTTQLDVATRSEEDVDCATPTEPPVPVQDDGRHLMFSNIDFVWGGTSERYLLVEQLPDRLALRRLGDDLEVVATIDEITHSEGLREHIDVGHGSGGIAAVTAELSGYTLYGFQGTDADVIDVGVEPNLRAIQLMVRGSAVFVVYLTDDGVFARLHVLWQG